MDKVANHSYSQYTFGQATEGRHSHTSAPYEPLDITELPTQYQRQIGQTPGEKNESANSQGMHNHEYAVLEEVTSEKAELHESICKKGNLPARGCNRSMATPLDILTLVLYLVEVLKGKSQELPPIMAKPSKPKIPPGSKPAAVAKVNLPVPLPPPAPGSGLPTHGAKPPPVSTLQDGGVLKNQQQKIRKSAKKPILPKHVTELLYLILLLVLTYSTSLCSFSMHMVCVSCYHTVIYLRV